MGADTKALRNRIKSVNSTLHLTKAMGLVASSKIRRATDAMLKSREYAAAENEAIGLLASCPECRKSPYMHSAENDTSAKTRIIVIAGDRGLAGGYNANVFRLASIYANAEFIPIGKRACDRYSESAISAEKFSTADAEQLAESLCKDFCEGKYDKLGILFTKYLSILKQEAELTWVLPLKADTNAKNTGIIFEPDEVTVLNEAVPGYVAGILMSCIRESFACEIAARRNAMDSAGKNAKQMIDELQLEYNRARQGAITQEITEIVAGSGL